MVPSISLQVFLWLQQFIIFYFYYTRENIHQQQKYKKTKNFILAYLGKKNTHKPFTQRKLLLSFASHFKLTITTQEQMSALWLAGTPGQNPLGPKIINQPVIQTAKCRRCIFSFACSFLRRQEISPTLPLWANHTASKPASNWAMNSFFNDWGSNLTNNISNPKTNRRSFFYTETHQVLLYPAARFAPPLPASVTG